MRLTNFNSRFIFIASAVLLVAVSRLVPHISNFASVGAMALFGGAYFSNRKMAYAIPLVALFISDAIIGFYGWGMLPVYGSFVLIIALGTLLGKKITPINVLIGSLLSSVLFFLITNFAFFYSTAMYPHNFAGIMLSYEKGLLFFRSTLESDLLFNGLLFGSFYLAQLKFPKLSKL